MARRAPFRRWQGLQRMTVELPLVEFDMAAFAQQIVETNGKVGNLLLSASHRSAAIVLVQALLVRELGRAGLIDTRDLCAEATARAAELGAPVVAAIQSIFTGDLPREPDMKPRFTVIAGGRPEA